MSLHQFLGRLAWLSGAAAAMTLGIVLFVYLSPGSVFPHDDAALTQAKTLWTRHQGDDIRDRVRQLDTQARDRYFARQQMAHRAAWLLVAFVAVAVCARQASIVYRPKEELDLVEADPAADLRQRHYSRVSIAVATAVMVGAGVLLGRWLTPIVGMPSAARNLPAGTLDPAFVDGPDDAAVAAQWAGFRGPNSGFHAASVPGEWDAVAGKHIRFRKPVPCSGPSSPVIWDNRVFLTGMSGPNGVVAAMDAGTGDTLWSESYVLSGVPADFQVNEDAGFACPTPVTDGERVYAMFGSGLVVGLDVTGKPLWKVQLGFPDNPYAHSSSLAAFRHIVLVQFDQGTEEGRSFLLALDGRTGKTLWKQSRPVAASWGGPTVIKVGQGYQALTVGNPWLIAYDLPSGREVWRCKGLKGETAPSPIFAGGKALAVVEHGQLICVRPDGQGDVSQSHLAWSATDGLPDICSPVSDGKFVYLLTTGGTLTAYALDDGAPAWDVELNFQFNASPTVAGGRLFATTTTGQTLVYELQGTEKPKLLATNPLGEPVRASLAIKGPRLYVRGQTHLVCVE